MFFWSRFEQVSLCCVCDHNRAEREVVLSNLDTLCSVALGEKVTEDFLLARDTVITIGSITDHVRVSLSTLGFIRCLFLIFLLRVNWCFVIKVWFQSNVSCSFQSFNMSCSIMEIIAPYNN